MCGREDLWIGVSSERLKKFEDDFGCVKKRKPDRLQQTDRQTAKQTDRDRETDKDTGKN